MKNGSTVTPAWVKSYHQVEFHGLTRKVNSQTIKVVRADVISCWLPLPGWGLSSSVIRKTRLEAVLGALRGIWVNIIALHSFSTDPSRRTQLQPVKTSPIGTLPSVRGGNIVFNSWGFSRAALCYFSDVGLTKIVYKPSRSRISSWIFGALRGVIAWYRKVFFLISDPCSSVVSGFLVFMAHIWITRWLNKEPKSYSVKKQNSKRIIWSNDDFLLLDLHRGFKCSVKVACLDSFVLRIIIQFQHRFRTIDAKQDNISFGFVHLVYTVKPRPVCCRHVLTEASCNSSSSCSSILFQSS